ncbi:MAG: peptide chain release factor N(5)-glutamine methyltransferase, partial [Dehalococcoidia bacterium]|nr:peptide chain release factor N(5)-glutamine methyltransferase [Dehalococcoidia bacterium]
VLLMRVLDASRAYLYAHRDEPVDAEDAEAYKCLLDRRERREPLAYITGVKEFFALDFYVDQRVLIPRPETETLVEECLRLLTQHGTQAPVLADIGTGSGAIAVALAHHLPEARVYAADSSTKALQVAFLNCLRHGVQDRVLLLQGNLLEPLPEPVDVILANLPYVPTSALAALAPEIALYEPRMALDGGSDGLDLIRGLLAQAPRRLRPGGAIMLEIGADQGADVTRAAAAAMLGASARVVKDLAGLDRVVVIELAA